ncbi:MAG TPA: AAA family ATPase, partial [Candidatus Acidoferrales bacterium]|nr:AAA family ATPase [Candidatus Acidoferrales bacterium]
GELAELEDALFASGRGDGGIVVLAGDAGLGKTRLASELRQRARKLGFEVMSGACSEAELSLPYLPFLEAVGNHLARSDTQALAARLGPAGRDLAELFPQLATEPVHADRSEPTQGKLRLFEAILGLLRAAAGDHGLLLIVEDLHWADASTRELLDYLTRRLTGNRILVVATYRSDEMHRRHPLVPTVQGWRRSGLARIVELQSLPAEQVGEMVRAIFDVDQVSAEFRDLLHERSEGNPFVLEEMLKDAIDRGDVFRTPDGWDRKPVAELKLPQSVADTILLRVERLGREEAEVVRAAAVLGRTFSYPLLVAVTGLPEQTVLVALEACVRQQLLEEDPGGQDRYRFRHALTREAVYEETIVPRRRQLHARAAEVLQSLPEVSSVDLAHHLIAAGRWEEGVPACLRAAEESEKRWGMAEAAALYELALPHVGDRLEQARLLCRLGTALVWAGHSPRAQPHLEEGIRTLEAMGESREAAHYRIFLGRTHWERLRHDLARQEYELARQALEPLGPSEDLALAYMRLASLRTFDFEGPEAVQLAQRGIEVAEACGSDFARIWTCIFLAGGLDAVGRNEEANRYLEQAYQEALAQGLEYLALNAAYKRGLPRHLPAPGQAGRRRVPETGRAPRGLGEAAADQGFRQGLHPLLPGRSAPG